MPPSSISTQPTTEQQIAQLERKSVLYRKTILELTVTARAGHIGGSLSCIDVLNVLYNHVMDIYPGNFQDIGRDHYIHSKGHSVEALYAVLLDLGFFTRETLATNQCQYSAFMGHPTRDIPGIEQNTGALGHGLSVAVGMALAAVMDHSHHRIFTLIGDGEMAEGSIWEAAASAAHYHLDNLVAVIDRNGLQISGTTDSVMSMEPLDGKLSAFGFAVRHVDGHDFTQLVQLFESLPFEKGKPNCVIAHTVKGKGISFIENKAEWHHHVPSEAEFTAGLLELETAERVWKERNANQCT